MPTPGRDDQSKIRGTTILSVRHDGKVVMAGDGQVSVGQTIMKRGARKVRRLHGDRVLAGFAGSTADALTLFDKFESKLQPARGDAGGRRPRKFALDFGSRRRH